MKRIAALFSVAVLCLSLANLVAPGALSASSAAKRKVAPRAVPDGGKAFAHVKFLASDEFKGRKSGTPEYRKAAEYVAAEMQKAGLKPGGENGTWFQEVPFKNWTDFEQPIRLEIVSPSRRVYFAGRGRDFTPVSGTGSGTAKGGLAFIGYGVVSEKDGWNDYAGLDVKGKIVLVMPDLPASFGNEAKNEWTFEKKVKTAAAKGAVGLIEMDLTTPGAQPAGPRPRLGRHPSRAMPRGLRRHEGRPRFPERRLLPRRQELARPRQQDAPPQEARDPRPRRRRRDGGPFRPGERTAPQRPRPPARAATPSSRTRSSSWAAISTISASASTASSTPAPTTTPRPSAVILETARALKAAGYQAGPDHRLRRLGRRGDRHCRLALLHRAPRHPPRQDRPLPEHRHGRHGRLRPPGRRHVRIRRALRDRQARPRPETRSPSSSRGRTTAARTIPRSGTRTCRPSACARARS